MTLSEAQVLRASWDLLVADPDSFATSFQRRLTLLEPRLRMIFNAPKRFESVALVAAISRIVAALEKPNQFHDVIEGIALRQRELGVKPSHFAPISHALLDTVAERLGSRHTDLIHSAWTAACVHVFEAVLAQRSNAMDLVA